MPECGSRRDEIHPGFYQTSVEEKGVDFIREIKNHVDDKRQMSDSSSFPQRRGRSGVLLGILGGGVPPGSPNPDLDSLKARFRFLLFRI